MLAFLQAQESAFRGIHSSSKYISDTRNTTILSVSAKVYTYVPSNNNIIVSGVRMYQVIIIYYGVIVSGGLR